MISFLAVLKIDEKRSRFVARFLKSFRESLKNSLVRMMNPRILAFYGFAIIILSVVSFLLPYQPQVYLSIAAGFAVAALLPLSMIMSRGLKTIDIVFLIGILFLVVALFQSGLPRRAVLENLRHFSLILSVVLTSLYVALVFRLPPLKPHAKSVKIFGDFLSVCSTTLSSEFCSCLHPTLLLEALGVSAFIENQVKLGFVIMMTTLVYQAKQTYESYKHRR